MLIALAFLTSWGNAPFAIAIGVGALFSILQLSGVLALIAGGGEGDADHDVDADADGSPPDADADHDVDPDQDHEGPDGGRGWAATALEPLGIGRIPFSMIWQSFALAFAMTGLALNARYLGLAGGAPVRTLAWTLPAAILAGYAITAGVARIFGPVLSSHGHEATTRAELVGQLGVVISSKVDRDFGEVRIRDKTGHDLRVVCKLVAGAKRVPTERQTVVIVDSEPDGGRLLVAPLEDEESYEGKGERRKS